MCTAVCILTVMFVLMCLQWRLLLHSLYRFITYLGEICYGFCHAEAVFGYGRCNQTWLKFCPCLCWISKCNSLHLSAVSLRNRNCEIWGCHWWPWWLLYCVMFCSLLDVICSFSDTLVTTYQTRWHHVLDDVSLKIRNFSAAWDILVLC